MPRRLDAKEFARAHGVSVRTAYRWIDAMLARQHDTTVLRIDWEPARIGSGAVRLKRVVVAANDNTNG